ncbi:MAG: hypothetical protein SGPRY_003682 [Prymnesium sp.]
MPSHDPHTEAPHPRATCVVLALCRIRYETWRRPFYGVTFATSPELEIEFYNRTVDPDEWRPNFSVPEVYESFAPAFGGFYSDGFDRDRELARDAEAAGIQTHAYIDVLPQLLNLTRIETGNITVGSVPAITRNDLLQAAGWLRRSFYTSLSLWPDQRDQDDDPGIVYYDTSSMRVSFLLYNKNVNKYVFCDMRVDQDPAGHLWSTSHIDSFDMFVVWSDWRQFTRPASVVLFFLAICLYLLVIVKTRYEWLDMLRTKRRTASYLGYWLSLYTWIEIVNLTCCYAYPALTIYSNFIPERRRFNPNDHFQYVDMSHVVLIERLILAVRGISMISAALACFKFLPLMPKTTSWYLTGTTFVRGGKDLKLLFSVIALFLTGWAVFANHAFGQDLIEFSTWVLTGDFRIARTILRRAVVESIVFDFVFFAVFYFNFILLLSPLILAILRDAYTVEKAGALPWKASTARLPCAEKVSECGALSLELMPTKQRGLMAAKDVLSGKLIEAAAAREYGLQREMVHYYKGVLMRQGFSQSPSETARLKAWEDYVNAYKMADKLCEKMGRKRAAKLATEK